MEQGNPPTPKLIKNIHRPKGFVLFCFVYLFSDGLIVVVGNLQATSLWVFCEVYFSIPIHIKSSINLCPNLISQYANS